MNKFDFKTIAQATVTAGEMSQGTADYFYGLFLGCSEVAELAALREDKARLDWLDEHMSYRGGGSGGTYSFFTPADVESGMLRAAIDAARQKDIRTQRILDANSR